MASNSHFTVALHILTWIALASQQQDNITSDQIAGSVNTNPVFIRRILGILHKAGLVNVQRGTGSRWTLTRSPEQISLLEVYQAVEQSPLFELHHTRPNQECVIGRGIQPALTQFYSDTEVAMKRQLAQSTVADVLVETLTLSSQSSQGTQTEARAGILDPG